MAAETLNTAEQSVEVAVVSDIPEAEKVETCQKETTTPEPVKDVAVEDDKKKVTA